MTLKEIIEAKIESAKTDLDNKNCLVEEHQNMNPSSSFEVDLMLHNITQLERLMDRIEGEIEAYEDILAILRSGKYEQV